MSAREELARRVLYVLSNSNVVPPDDALQLRSWALTAEDALLPLTEIALRILGLDSTPVGCEERQRLNRVYLAATTKVFDAGKADPHMKSVKWREATKEARAFCKAALVDIIRHRKEHGC
jgi:hypothetical protein